MGDLISLKEFRKQIETAEYDEHAETLETAVGRLMARGGTGRIAGIGQEGASASTVAARSFEEIKTFLSRMYEGVTASHTFVDAGGNVIDCVPFDQQPSVKAAKRQGIEVPSSFPPPPQLNHAREAEVNAWTAAPRPTGLVPPLRRGSVDPFGNKVAVPPDAVPLRRLSLARLVRKGSLERHFRRPPPPNYDPRPALRPTAVSSPSASGPGSFRFAPDSPGVVGVDNDVHRWAALSYGVAGSGYSLSGASSFMNVWRPNPDPGGMALSQLWIKNATGTETIESGWQVSPGNNSNSRDPILFIYYNPASYFAGDPVGFEQGYQLGFVAATGAHWARGSTMVPYSSQSPTSQVGFLMNWQRDTQGNWTLYMGTSAHDLTVVGGFPAGFYGSLSQGAQFAMFGGEVAAQPGYDGTGQMGSGVMPSDASFENYGLVAFQNQLQVAYTGREGIFDDIPAQQLMPANPDPNYQAYAASAEGWGTYFFFGGGKAP